MISPEYTIKIKRDWHKQIIESGWKNITDGYFVEIFDNQTTISFYKPYKKNWQTTIKEIFVAIKNELHL
jgi:hypothetical protein